MVAPASSIGLRLRPVPKRGGEPDGAPNAVRYITSALKLDPAAPPLLHSLGIIRSRVMVTFNDLPVTDAAIPSFFRLLSDLRAVDAAALIKHSQHLAAEGNQEEALALAQEAVALEPSTGEALRHLARLLDGVGRHEEARAGRREAAALAVTFPCPQATA